MCVCTVVGGCSVMSGNDDGRVGHKRPRRLLSSATSTTSSSSSRQRAPTTAAVGGERRQLYRLRSAASTADKQKLAEKTDVSVGLDPCRQCGVDSGDLLVISAGESTTGDCDADRRGRMEQILRSLEDHRRCDRRVGHASQQQRRQRRLSTAAQLRETQRGVIDLQTPDSILTRVQVRSLLNSSVFCRLPSIYQLRLASLLPEADHRCGADGNMRLNRGSLSNEFVTRACHQWQERLGRGEFTHDHISRQRSDLETRKRRLDPWKVRNFEPVWGQSGQKRSVSPVSRSAVSALSQPLPQLTDPGSIRGPRRSWQPVRAPDAAEPVSKPPRLHAPVVALERLGETASGQTALVSSPDSTVPPTSPTTDCVDGSMSLSTDCVVECGSPCVDPSLSLLDEECGSSDESVALTVAAEANHVSGEVVKSSDHSMEIGNDRRDHCSPEQHGPTGDNGSCSVSGGDVMTSPRNFAEDDDRLSIGQNEVTAGCLSVLASPDSSPSVLSSLSVSGDRLESTRLSWEGGDSEPCSTSTADQSDSSRMFSERVRSESSVCSDEVGGGRSDIALSINSAASSSGRVSLQSDSSQTEHHPDLDDSGDCAQKEDISRQDGVMEQVVVESSFVELSATGSANIQPKITDSIDLVPGTTDTINLVPATGDSFDLIPRNTDSIDLIPGTTDSIDLIPRTTDSIDFIPRNTASIDLIPGTTDSIGPIHRTTDSIDLIPRTTIDPIITDTIIPQTSDSIDLVPRTMNSIDLSPSTTDSIDLIPRTSDSIDLVPRTMNSIDLSPTTDSIDLIPRTSDSIDLVPRTTDSIDLNPRTLDSIDLVPRSHESLDLQSGVCASSGSGDVFIGRTDAMGRVSRDLDGIVPGDANTDLENLNCDVSSVCSDEHLSSVLESSTLTDDEAGVVPATISSRYPALYDTNSSCLSPEVAAPPPVLVPTLRAGNFPHQTSVQTVVHTAQLQQHVPPGQQLHQLTSSLPGPPHLVRPSSALPVRLNITARTQRPHRPRSQTVRSSRHSRPPTGSVNLERSYQICQAVIAKSQNRAQLQAQMKPLPRLLAENRSCHSTQQNQQQQRVVEVVRSRADLNSTPHSPATPINVKYLQVPGQKVVTAARLVSLPSAGPSTTPAVSATGQTLVLGEVADNGTVLLRKELLVRGRQKVYQVCGSSGKTMLVVRPVLTPASCPTTVSGPRSIGSVTTSGVVLPRSAAACPPSSPSAEGVEAGSRVLMMVAARGAAASSESECSCQLRPMVVCRRCGAYCHDDCLHGGGTCTACR